MHLQNKEINIKYSIVLDQDDLNLIILGLEYGVKNLMADKYERVMDTISALKDYHNRGNEPTERDRNIRFDDPNL